MFKTLLVGLDGSPDSEAAIPVVADIARRYDALVVLCHVEERVVGKGGPQPIHDVETIQAGIQVRAKELSDQGIDTKVEWGASTLGGPAQVLEAIADRLKAELIAGTAIAAIPPISPRTPLMISHRRIRCRSVSLGSAATSTVASPGHRIVPRLPLQLCAISTPLAAAGFPDADRSSTGDDQSRLRLWRGRWIRGRLV